MEAAPRSAAEDGRQGGEYEIVLDRSEGQRLGIDVDHQDGRAPSSGPCL